MSLNDIQKYVLNEQSDPTSILIEALSKQIMKTLISKNIDDFKDFEMKYDFKDGFFNLDVYYPIDKLEVYKPTFVEGGKAPERVITEGFFERQERLGCGRHALNNLLGGKNFIYEYDPPKNVNSIEELTIPVSLQTLCRYISEKSEFLKDENPACPDNENYHIAVLTAGMRLYGFEDVIQINKKLYDEKTKKSKILQKDDVKKIIDAQTDIYGYLIHFPGHWTSMRRLDRDKYEYMDSLNREKKEGNFDTIYNIIGRFDIITGYRYTGITTDLIQISINKYSELLPECTEKIKQWFDGITQHVINKEIPKKYVDEFFYKNPDFELDTLRSCIGSFSNGGIFIPNDYIIPGVASAASATTSASATPDSINITIEKLKKELQNELQKGYFAEDLSNNRWNEGDRYSEIKDKADKINDYIKRININRLIEKEKPALYIKINQNIDNLNKALRSPLFALKHENEINELYDFYITNPKPFPLKK